MYINFQQTRVSRSVQTVHTNIFANNRNLHKFASLPKVILRKKDYLDMHHHITYMYINFNKIGLVRRSLENRAHNLFAKKRKLYIFATTNSNLKKKIFFRHAS